MSKSDGIRKRTRTIKEAFFVVHSPNLEGPMADRSTEKLRSSMQFVSCMHIGVTFILTQENT